MKDTLTLAHINMNVILRNIENLCRIDETAKSLVASDDIAIGFRVKNGPSCTLRFSKGECEFIRGTARGRVLLYFKSPDHFNAMVEGTANPIPLRGLFKLGFLTGAFKELSALLERYLRPSDEDLADPVFRTMSTELTLYTAGYAIGEVGTVDPMSKGIGGSMPTGEIVLEVANGPSLVIYRDDKRLVVERRRSDSSRAAMTFSDMDSAFAMLTGTIDSYSAIAQERLRLRGFVPMLDKIDKLLFKVSEYLK